MPQHDRSTYLTYQRAYYARNKKQLAKRAKLRQRLLRGTPTLWSILPEPRGFCAAMAQKAINQAGGVLPPAITKEDLCQDIAEALVQGRAVSRLTNPLQYAAALAIRLAIRQIKKEGKHAISSQN